jgi:hypothetical protein
MENGFTNNKEILVDLTLLSPINFDSYLQMDNPKMLSLN